MTRVDSSIPEVISMLERNDDGSIQKTISEAIEELSFEGGIRTGIETGQSTESNITEEIAQVCKLAQYFTISIHLSWT